MVARLAAAAALVGLVVVAPGPRRLDACAPAPAPGQFVSVTEESAVIIWDATTQTEHFIRRAAFDTAARDFGFLVPTPTRPQLAEADERLFWRLEQQIRPEVLYESRLTGVDLTPLLVAWFSRGSVDNRKAGSVQVLDAVRVAGFDAVVLQADDASALNRWLGDHGYASSDDLTAWLAPYVTARWTITAFKIASDAGAAPRLDTSAVRMSFQTDRPVFPYREPESQRRGGPDRPAARSLALFVLSDSRMDGRLDEAATTWPGQVTWADALAPSLREELVSAAGLAAGQVPERLWLTAFLDTSQPRPGVADLYFTPAAATVTKPAPIVREEPWTLPLLPDVWLALGAIGAGLGWRRRRARVSRGR